MKSPTQRIPVMTLTDELYLPTRLIYEVYDVKQLRAWLQKTSCLTWDPGKQRWTWDYDGAAHKLEFPPAYEQVPADRQPVVLASCYLVDDHAFHVYTRCGFRTVKFLVFFDRQVSRSIAMGKFMDQYNLVTAVASGATVPFPEDYFKEESKLEFYDTIDLMDSPNSPSKQAALAAYFAAAAQRTLRPLERHRLDGFYHDGPARMEQSVHFREMMAGLQHQSDKPIRPMEEISRLLAAQDNAFPGELSN